MSVGIVVANKRGIAIATDSATTLGNRGLVYHTYQKLIHLAPTLPVAVALYSNIEFMRVPIDILIAHYQQALMITQRRLSELLAYPDDFIKHLEKHKIELHIEAAERHFIDHNIRVFVETMIDNNDMIDPTTLTSINDFEKWIGQVEHYIDSIDKLDLESMEDYVYTNYFQMIQMKVKDFFPKLPFTESLEKRVIHSLTKLFDTIYSDTITGMVFAGYGENNLYPSFRGIYLIGMINGKIRYFETKRFIVNEEYTRGLFAFAQSHAIDNFIDGIDPDVQSDLFSSFQKLWTKKINEIDPTSLSSEKQEIILDTLSKMEEDFDDTIFEVTKQRWSPLYVAIQNMPLAELGYFSESMVHIATLHNKYSSDEETGLTVGGPIDVATIDRSRGLNWVHHK